MGHRTHSLRTISPVLDEDAAKYLVSCGLKGVGTDALSVGPSVISRVSRPQDPAAGRPGDSGEPVPEKKVVGRTDIMLLALPMKFETPTVRRSAPSQEFRTSRRKREMEQRVEKFLAILVCAGTGGRPSRGQGKLPMPGKFALKICPDILAGSSCPTLSPSPGPTARPPPWK